MRRLPYEKQCELALLAAIKSSGPILTTWLHTNRTLSVIRQTSLLEQGAGFHNPEIRPILRASAAFSEKRKNLRLNIKTGGIVDVRQRPEETNRQSFSARRRESLLEHGRRAPLNIPKQDLMKAFDRQQNVAPILGRPQYDVVVDQSPISVLEVIPAKGRTIATDQINPLTAISDFPAHCGC